MSIEIPSRKMRDILNDEQIFLLIYNDGSRRIVLDNDGPKPNPDAYIMITLQAAKQMVADMEAVLDISLAEADAGALGDQIYHKPIVALH